MYHEYELDSDLDLLVKFHKSMEQIDELSRLLPEVVDGPNGLRLIKESIDHNVGLIAPIPTTPIIPTEDAFAELPDQALSYAKEGLTDVVNKIRHGKNEVAAAISSGLRSNVTNLPKATEAARRSLKAAAATRDTVAGSNKLQKVIDFDKHAYKFKQGGGNIDTPTVLKMLNAHKSMISKSRSITNTLVALLDKLIEGRTGYTEMNKLVKILGMKKNSDITDGLNDRKANEVAKRYKSAEYTRYDTPRLFKGLTMYILMPDSNKKKIGVKYHSESRNNTTGNIKVGALGELDKIQRAAGELLDTVLTLKELDAKHKSLWKGYNDLLATKKGKGKKVSFGNKMRAIAAVEALYFYSIVYTRIPLSSIQCVQMTGKYLKLSYQQYRK